MKRSTVVVALLLLAACVKSDIDQHRQNTRRMLEARGAPDFVDASTVEYAAIRHTPSGMLCVLPADGVFDFDVFPVSAMNSGAQCSGTDGDVAIAWVAVKFREPTTLDAAFASAVSELVGGLQARPWEGRPSEADRASPQGLPHYRIHRLAADLNGEQRYLRIAMSEREGWYLQQIVSAPLENVEDAEAHAGEEWRRTIRAFAAAPQG